VRFARIGEPGAEKPYLVHRDTFYSIEDLVGDIDASFWTEDGPHRCADALARGSLTAVGIDRENQRFGPPIARPSDILCVGLNYAAHAAESGAEPPGSPILFHKAPNTLAGPTDPIVIPPGSTKTDWEVELGVVMGRRLSYSATPTEAASCIGGYVLVNDLSERAYQLEHSGGQWSKGKSCPGFCPAGPFLVTPDQLDPAGLRLRSWVNGRPRQDSTTSDLIFDVSSILHHFSQYLILEPGDLICTGTPEGVGLSGRFPYLRDGDIVEIEIAGLGRHRQRCESA
jgi:2-keto-4-pentenoate hydratase/2-oxohepta-3-ene-1,7-dioic acid hydratase in catechol pathway